MRLLMTCDGKSYLYKNADMHTKHGFVRKEDIDKARSGTILKTNTGTEMVVLEAQFIDLFKKIKRGAQIMLPKDICTIVSVCGINKDTRLVEAGSGSGASGCFFASIAKKVYSYEKRTDHYEISLGNGKFIGLKNLVFKNKDVYDGISEKDIDVVVLDLPEPWGALASAKKALLPGGFLVSYSPNMTQVQRIVSALRGDAAFVYLKTMEVIEREWEVDEMKLRPKFEMLGHTGFLTFARKIL